ncbi:OLC1v1035903C1 [Oldenlandia corymbosa var. corymbosa]|uniref:OLC1v1035903C1 n=1 Tax=Oldenlandia corymbosa var. corymbosa TaxID=529605 RepID=A0AAV1CXH3_OLDCO|nr:OLC1v1035903C1 [Oldenlandia corymbosa var. corymbosa]
MMVCLLRKSYDELISKIYMTLGWDPAHVKLHLSVIFDSPGGRRIVKIKNDSHVEFMNRVAPLSCLDLYIDLEDITHEEREASLENNMSFGGFPRGERASTSGNCDEEETPLFAQDDYMEESDPGYRAPSESKEDRDFSAESDFEESDDELLKYEERDLNPLPQRHVYNKMGKWDASCVDKDEFALKMWDETPEGMDIGVCFKSQSEAKHAVELLNIHHKREYTVAASSPKTWAVRCRTLNVESEDGKPPCEWKVRVSLKDHGLHEIVRWHDAHNCMTPVNDNDNRCVDASLIARLIRRKVEDNVDYTVALAQKDVKTLLKVDVPYKRAWHGRRKAIEAVYGDWTSNFEELPRYIAELKFTNPVTVVEWEWKEGQEASFDATLFDGDDARWRAVTATRLSDRGGSLHMVNYDEHRWECWYTYGDVPRSSLPPFRDQLTSLRIEDFWWQPYAKVLDRLPDFCKQGQAIWTTRCWMFCWAIREPHESGRVVRQFGYMQGVSSRPMIKDNTSFLLDHAHSMSGYSSNNWMDHHSAVRPHWRKREKYVLQDLEVGYPGEVYEGYYEWFMMKTVKLISNPKNYEPKGYETSSRRVKLYGESIEQHSPLTLGANDEIDVDDTQILVDEEPSMPSQPPLENARQVPDLLITCNSVSGHDIGSFGTILDFGRLANLSFRTWDYHSVMTMDIDSPDIRNERRAGGYDALEEDGVEKRRESSKHRVKEKSKSSRREDKDQRSKDREHSKTSRDVKDREKEPKDLEKDRSSGKDRRHDDRDKLEKVKSHDKVRENRDRDRDKERKDRENEKDRERELDRDSERGRDKERGKERSRDKDKDREKEREKPKEHGRGRENERERQKNVVDRDKGKESSREKEPDQDGARQRDRDRNTTKHRDEDRDKSKYSTKDNKSGSDIIADQGDMDLDLRDMEDGMVTEKQQHEDGEVAASPVAASELEDRIKKMREERLNKKSEGASEVLSWIAKSRKIEEKRNAEREKALQLSKIFEEQDNMVGGDDDEDTTPSATHDLAGVKVLHGLDKVLEGGAVVLTLKDQNILSDTGVNEEVDVLENVEIGEQKRRDDAYKAAKKKSGMYEDKFNVEDDSERKILPQYDDPVADEGVTLDARGRFTGEAEKKLEELRRRIQGIPKSNNAEDLNSTGKVLSDYYTQDEMLQFKKPKKKKSLRKKEKLDIDALEAEAKSAGLGVEDLGSRSDGRRQVLREEEERNDSEMRNTAYQSALAKADEASKALRQAQNMATEKVEDDTPVIGDDDDDLRKSLDRARKLALKAQADALTSNPLPIAILASSAATEQGNSSAEASENKVVFTEMELWSHQLDEEAQKSDAEDVFMEEDPVPKVAEMEAKQEDGGWSEVKESTEEETPKSEEEEIVPDATIHEVPVGKGLAGALKLLQERGSLKETVEWGGRNMDKKKSKLVGIHDDEGPKEIHLEKTDEHGKRVKPKEIHLERTDEYGRILTPKEAFRLLSHKFHGKGPGKMKQEKRMRQYQEELKVKQMKNADTPSLSVERMKETQARLQTPYLVITGQVKPGQTSDPRSGFATVEKDLAGGLTPMLGDKKVEYFLGKRKPEHGNGGPEKKPKS